MEEFQPLQYYWNLRVHDSEFLQLRAISAAYAQFVWVCLKRGGGEGGGGGGLYLSWKREKNQSLVALFQYVSVILKT